MNAQRLKLTVVMFALVAGVATFAARGAAARGAGALDDALVAALDAHGFTGHVGHLWSEGSGARSITGSRT